MSTVESMIRRAFKEACVDTFVALPLNFVINWIILSIAFELSWGATMTTVIATILFTFLALIRKTYVRVSFAKRYNQT